MNLSNTELVVLSACETGLGDIQGNEGVWLTEKKPIPDAFRAAQKAIQDKYKHPFFWAGFVLAE